MKNLKVERNVAVFEAFYPLNLSLFDVKRGFNCSIPFYKIHGYNKEILIIHNDVFYLQSANSLNLQMFCLLSYYEED